MRLFVVLCMMLVLTPVVCSARQDSRLEGCVDPAVIAKVLGEMRPDNSRPISVEQFRAMWPVELVGAEVNAPADRLSFRSNDRILKGHCQCCETFTFNVRAEGGNTPLQLRGVTVNYSARRRDALVEMAKLFAQSVGLGAADLKTVGAEQTQNYQWEKIKGDERRVYALDLGFTREDGLWKMHFNAAFYVVEP